MSDGEKILSCIKSESDEKIAAVNADADRVCAELLAEARKNAEEIRHSAETKIELQSEKLIKATKSRIELEKRSELLRARRAEIDKTLDGIGKYLCSLGDKEYFGLLYSLASGLSGKSGVILLNKKDLARLPADFEKQMDSIGLKISVSKTPCDSIGGGFILKDGDIEENMTFSALIAEKREQIEDLISRELFKD